MAANQQVQERTRKALEHYLFNRERPESDYPPRGLPREELVAYFEDRLERPMPAAAYARVRAVFDFYDLVEALPALEKPLQQPPHKSDDYVRALEFNTARAAIGDARQRAAALDFYEKVLVSHSEAYEHFPTLLVCYAEGAPESTSDSIKKSIANRMKQLRPQIEQNYDQRIEHSELEALLNNDVPEAEDAHATRKRVGELKDDPARIREWVRMYLELEYAGGPYLHPWSVRMLKRSAAKDPKPVVDALREALARVQHLRLDAEEADFLRRRALRAIDYFGGPLEPPERKFLDKFRGKEGADDDAIWKG